MGSHGAPNLGEEGLFTHMGHSGFSLPSTGGKEGVLSLENFIILKLTFIVIMHQ